MVNSVNFVKTTKSQPLFGPRCEKTCLQGFCQSKIQISLLSYRDNLENEISPVASLNMKFSKKANNKGADQTRGCAGWSAHVLFANPRRQVLSQRGPFVSIALCGKIYDNSAYYLTV